jgi:superfamily I DNA/RNA helicase
MLRSRRLRNTTMSLHPTSIHPSPEQQRARELFLEQEGLRIDAYAGAGKTTTLRLLASSTKERGLYLAFNRSIAEEARGKFPTQVACATSHSLAFRTIARSFGYPAWKLTGTLTPNTVVEAFRMPDALTFHSGLTLSKWSYCSVLLDAVKRFLQSNDEHPQQAHIPRYGCLEALDAEGLAQFTGQAIGHVQALWDAMRHKNAGLPLGHDGYLKLWALSQPKARVDYILVDEAQDLNPVLLGVLKRMDCSVVYVGDPYQQIYEWRGAVNAIAQVATPHNVLLSQSYRFGPAIATAATAILRSLGAKHPVRGLEAIQSHLAVVHPQVILSRTNAGVIGNVLKCLSCGIPCHVLGGTRGLEMLLTDVRRVKQGQAGQSPELLGFATWKDVMSFSTRTEGEYLRGLVNLVQEYGEETMLRAIAGCVPNEGDARIVCSTTHKAKGREWGYVKIDPDFLSARPPSTRSEHQESIAAELRLLYVAVTRAKYAVDLPQSLLRRFGLNRTTSEVLGAPSAPKAIDNGPTSEDPRLSGVVSPYHSPTKGESREMTSLRRIFG